ncbi:MAG: protein TolA, partial [Firmicutes bacterium]|nr:protein TolA [Bacillota bacterium]
MGFFKRLFGGAKKKANEVMEKTDLDEKAKAAAGAAQEKAVDRKEKADAFIEKNELDEKVKAAAGA